MTATTTPSVLFVCVRNSGKSQMAAALLRQAAPGLLRVHSAGTDPGAGLNPLSVQVLDEVGATVDGEHPKPLDPALAAQADVVVVLGREAELDLPPGPRLLRWDTDEPSTCGIDGIERMRLIREDIADRVRTLLTELIDTHHPASTDGETMTDTSPVAPARYLRDDLTIDQQLALKTAATRLGREFDGVFGTETIERFLRTSYDQFAGRATVVNFLPLLAERFARQRLHALARVEGKAHTGTPTVLFLCTHNAGRSQMALGFFTHLAGDHAVAWSGGSEPGDAINPAAVEAMREAGIDITAEFPKPWTEEIIQAADVIITMGCGDACPLYPGRRYEEWTLDDPADLTLDAIRPIRDDIETRVRALLTELDLPTTAKAADQ